MCWLKNILLENLLAENPLSMRIKSLFEICCSFQELYQLNSFFCDFVNTWTIENSFWFKNLKSVCLLLKWKKIYSKDCSTPNLSLTYTFWPKPLAEDKYVYLSLPSFLTDFLTEEMLKSLLWEVLLCWNFEDKPTIVNRSVYGASTFRDHVRAMFGPCLD